MPLPKKAAACITTPQIGSPAESLSGGYSPRQSASSIAHRNEIAPLSWSTYTAAPKFSAAGNVAARKTAPPTGSQKISPPVKPWGRIGRIESAAGSLGRFPRHTARREGNGVLKIACCLPPDRRSDVRSPDVARSPHRLRAGGNSVVLTMHSCITASQIGPEKPVRGPHNWACQQPVYGRIVPHIRPGHRKPVQEDTAGFALD